MRLVLIFGPWHDNVVRVLFILDRGLLQISLELGTLLSLVTRALLGLGKISTVQFLLQSDKELGVKLLGQLLEVLLGEPIPLLINELFEALVEHVIEALLQVSLELSAQVIAEDFTLRWLLLLLGGL